MATEIKIFSIPDRSFEEIQIGDKAIFKKTMTESDITLFAGITGCFSPIHVDEEFCKKTMFKKRLIPGLLSTALIDTTMTYVGGASNIHLSQSAKFLAPVFIGDTITLTSEVISKDPAKYRVTIKSTITNQEEKVVLEGESVFMIPRQKG